MHLITRAQRVVCCDARRCEASSGGDLKTSKKARTLAGVSSPPTAHLQLAIGSSVSPHGEDEQASEGDAEGDDGEGLKGMLGEHVGTEISTSNVGASVSPGTDRASAPAPEPVAATASPEGDFVPPPPPPEDD